MTTIAAPKRSFGSLSGINPTTMKSLRSIPLPNSPIPEESIAKEKQSIESPVSGCDTTQDHSGISTNGSSPPRDPCNQSMMLQNASPSSVLSRNSTPRVSASLMEGPDGKKLKRFGTFVGESNKLNFNASTASMALSPSSKSNLVHAKVKFLDKEDWVDSNKCHICVKEFKKMNGVFEHHCRVCGHAACGDCSSKKINDNRVCDVCYVKIKNARGEKRREAQLKSKVATMKIYKKQLEKEKGELDQLFQKKFELNKKIEEDKKDHKSAIDTLQQERNKAAEILVKKKDTNVKLKETLAIDKALLKDKEIEFEELKNKINALKVQIGQKRNNFDSKTEELSNLYRQAKIYEESPSFVNMMNNMPVREKSESVVTVISMDKPCSTKANSRLKI